MTATKLPESIDVGPFTYTVVTDELDVLRTCVSEHKELLGFHDEKALRIVVDPSQAPGQQRDTLLHELLHAVAAMTGADLGDNEEKVVRRLSPALLDLLRRNPNLVRFLTAT